MNSSSTAKTILFWISIVFLGVMLWKLVSSNGQANREITPSYSEFMVQVEEGDVKEVTMYLSPNSYELQGEYLKPANSKFRITIPKENAPDITKELHDKAVMLSIKEVRSGDWVLILLNALPLLLLAGFVFFLMRQMQAGGNKALSFGKSRARLLSAQQKKATFKDVAGSDEAKEELQEIIEFLKDPQKFQKLAAASPRAFSLSGLPARAKPFSRVLSRVKPMCRSFPFPAPISWKCSLALAPAASATFSSRARRTLPASSSSMKLTLLAVTGARASAVVTTNASKP